MREHLYVLIDDLLATFGSKKPKENMGKLILIEETMNRDKSMMKALNGMLRYAYNATTLDALQGELLDILKEVRIMPYRSQTWISCNWFFPPPIE